MIILKNMKTIFFFMYITIFYNAPAACTDEGGSSSNPWGSQPPYPYASSSNTDVNFDDEAGGKYRYRQTIMMPGTDLAQSILRESDLTLLVGEKNQRNTPFAGSNPETIQDDDPKTNIPPGSNPETIQDDDPKTNIPPEYLQILEIPYDNLSITQKRQWCEAKVGFAYNLEQDNRGHYIDSFHNKTKDSCDRLSKEAGLYFIALRDLGKLRGSNTLQAVHNFCVYRQNIVSTTCCYETLEMISITRNMSEKEALDKLFDTYVAKEFKIEKYFNMRDENNAHTYSLKFQILLDFVNIYKKKVENVVKTNLITLFTFCKRRAKAIENGEESI